MLFGFVHWLATVFNYVPISYVRTDDLLTGDYVGPTIAKPLIAAVRVRTWPAH